MEWIDDVIAGLLDLYNTRDVYELYDALQIAIVELSEDNPLLKGNKAIYHRDYQDDETVFIREDLSDGYKEFILAHELGHAIIHIKLTTNIFNGLTNKGKIEKQANLFAIKLLDLEGKLDSIALEGFTIEQIASTLKLPMESLELIKEMKESYSA